MSQKLLLLIDWEYPCDHLFLQEVYNKRLSRQGFEIIWVMRSNRPHQTDIETTDWNGDKVYVLPESAYDPARTALLGLTGRLPTHPVARIISRHSDTDIIQVRNDLALGLVASRMKEEIDAKYYHQISHLKSETLLETVREGLADSAYKTYTKGKLGQHLRKYISNRADLILPISNEMKHQLQQSGYTTSMTVLTTGARVDIDLNQIDPQHFIEEYNLMGFRNLLYMGSMHPLRKLEFLFDVISLIDNPRVKLLMMGGRHEEYRTRLERLANQKNVTERVVFTGWIDDSETINQAICAADLGLSPLPPNNLFKTNAPIKILEYLSHETPVVATNTPDQRMVLTESEAGAVTAYTPEAFSEAIVSLLSSNSLSERGKSGREYIVEQRSFDKLSDIMHSIYQ